MLNCCDIYRKSVFLLSREDGKDSLKFYTDPGYFFDLWCKKMIERPPAGAGQRKKRKVVNSLTYARAQKKSVKFDKCSLNAASCNSPEACHILLCRKKKKRRHRQLISPSEPTIALWHRARNLLAILLRKYLHRKHQQEASKLHSSSSNMMTACRHRLSMMIFPVLLMTCHDRHQLLCRHPASRIEYPLDQIYPRPHLHLVVTALCCPPSLRTCLRRHRVCSHLPRQ
jgi:hypothetical protein